MGKKIKIDEFELPDGVESLEDLVTNYGAMGGRISQLQQAAALAEKFKAWGNPDDLEARIKNWAETEKQKAVEAALAQGATKTQAKQAGTDVKNALLDQFDDLPAAQKVEFLLAQLTPQIQQTIHQTAQQYWTEAQKQIGQNNGMSQQQFNLLAKGLQYKMQDPGFDLNKLWSETAAITSASPEKLVEMAYNNLQTPAMQAQREKELRAQWDTEQKKKQDAENLKVLNSETVPSWSKPKEERVSLKDGEDNFRNHILRGFMEKGELRPEQI